MAKISSQAISTEGWKHEIVLKITNEELLLLHDLVDIPLQNLPPFAVQLRKELGQIIRKEGL